ncbi:hypothetical protein A8F94_15775 [Bacillus sp. FJAT-27225]|uniref:hypothetical protein n=1 Tax=Bacillus sp. FJAT-27225 TaxID=1743144 RepID=UPI00080C2065|nr:hypothetical protein [Bacillus sp. FJAT-27225]OCA84178.1 hypothetical protein A8F94_15775 [Bacillus sp. FJAT-27225]
MDQTLYVSDTFFSAGRSDIFNEGKEKVGELDLKSAFSTSLDVLNSKGEIVYSGRFPFFSNKWEVSDSTGEEVGYLKARFAFFAQKYAYSTRFGRTFEIESEALSNLYIVNDESEQEVGRFEKINGFFSAPAFQVTSLEGGPEPFELIAVVMGVNELQKASRRRTHNNT